MTELNFTILREKFLKRERDRIVEKKGMKCMNKKDNPLISVGLRLYVWLWHMHVMLLTHIINVGILSMSQTIICCEL